VVKKTEEKLLDDLQYIYTGYMVIKKFVKK
jgi:hypothetical protein